MRHGCHPVTDRMRKSFYKEKRVEIGHLVRGERREGGGVVERNNLTDGMG